MKHCLCVLYRQQLSCNELCQNISTSLRSAPDRCDLDHTSWVKHVNYQNQKYWVLQNADALSSQNHERETKSLCQKLNQNQNNKYLLKLLITWKKGHRFATCNPSNDNAGNRIGSGSTGTKTATRSSLVETGCSETLTKQSLTQRCSSRRLAFVFGLDCRALDLLQKSQQHQWFVVPRRRCYTLRTCACCQVRLTGLIMMSNTRLGWVKVAHWYVTGMVARDKHARAISTCRRSWIFFA